MILDISTITILASTFLCVKVSRFKPKFTTSWANNLQPYNLPEKNKNQSIQNLWLEVSRIFSP